MTNQIADIVKEAVEAANKAGYSWWEIANPEGEDIAGRMFDMCGGAYIEFSDGRDAWYKKFKKAGFITSEYSKTISIAYKWRGRQEQGLKERCIRAAAEVLRNHGITKIRVRSYVD